MLKDLEALARILPQKIACVETLKEVRLPHDLAFEIQSKLQDLYLSVGNYTSFSVTDRSSNNYALIPNQFYAFSVELMDFAVALREYFDLFDKIRPLIKYPHDNSNVKSELHNVGVVDEQDISRFINFFFGSKESRFGAKSIEDGSGYRGSSDCFGSVILTRVNIPNSSSSIFGDVVYRLSSDIALYARLYEFFKSKQVTNKVNSLSSILEISKPFLLLAGISGTGKSRFVRKQAEASGDGKSNFQLVCVRPDWHEPADLLGYVSRIGGQPEYVATDVLRFMAAAWREAFDGADSEGLLAKTDALTPYWLCLDEMNLAPVEQYFADYLSVLETRQWEDGVYRCEPLLTAAVIAQLEDTGRNKLRENLQLADEQWDGLWQAFCKHGIPLPPNLVVAGTVNMDETTHGFSRKVIDRAITLDFGEFFPNDFDSFFGDQPLPVTLGYPRLTCVTQSDFAAVTADNAGSNTVAFLKAVNAVLKGTPFELAYRALNELLLAVVLASPADDKALQAVWDDFLMTKVLPRIDGDEERLAWRAADSADKTVLDGLLEMARSQLAAITAEEGRPDLLRTAPDGQPLTVPCRSLKKLGWMQQRLAANRFTSFWP